MEPLSLAPAADQQADEFTAEDATLVYKLFDADGNGKISAAELANAMATLGDHMQADEIEAMLGAILRHFRDALPSDTFGSLFWSFPWLAGFWGEFPVLSDCCAGSGGATLHAGAAGGGLGRADRLR